MRASRSRISSTSPRRRCQAPRTHCSVHTETGSSRWAGSVTFALGELDPSFGNHPAYLALEQDGRALSAPELVVPGDVDDARIVFAADRITVGVQNRRRPRLPPGVAAVGSDASLATITPAEAPVGGRPRDVPGSQPGAQILDVDPGDPERARDAAVLGGEHSEQHMAGVQAPIAALGRDRDSALERELG